MRTRLVLILVAVLGAVLVLAVGLSRPTYVVGETELPCADIAFSAAAKGLLDESRDPCAAQAQERLFTVAASLMGLVLVSGLLSRRRD